MQKEKKSDDPKIGDDSEETDAIELVLFQVSECYVYIIPPRKTAASYRADEWDVNKWAWEGILKVVSKGEECIIKLEDKKTGELYARAFLRKGEPHPVEPVIDSSRYFVLRIEENIDGRLRHAFIGIGFRERTEAYDFQAALHDHMKYLNKKQTAEEMEQHYQQTSSVDYSLKEGETLKLQIKTNKDGHNVKSKLLEQGLKSNSEEKGDTKESKLSPPSIKLPPPPPAPVSPPTTVQRSPPNFSVEKTTKDETLPPSPPAPVSPPATMQRSPPNFSVEKTTKDEIPKTDEADREQQNLENQSTQEDIPDDDFGDFQTAG